jgi:secreted PhoX family phosphatase
VINGFKAGDDFEAVPVPQGAEMKRLVIASGTYQALGRTGESIPNAAPAYSFGQINSSTGSRIGVCNNPDGNMFLSTAADGSEGYLYTNWECAPGGFSKLYIKMNADKKWDVIEGDNVDLSGIGGTWNNCNASVSPWNTGLSSEESPADVEDAWAGGWLPAADKMKSHLGYDANPFAYGYAIELIPAGGERDGIGTKVIKHYAMGRFSREMSLVMPDKKTVYSGDDGTDRVLFKFVADKEGDLSAGTLYAAKIKQDGDTLHIEWIKLGSGNDADVAKAVADLAPKK